MTSTLVVVGEGYVGLPMALRAAEWVETLKVGDRANHAAFLEWLRESKLHVQHYLETEALDRQIKGLPPRCGADVDALLAKIAPNVTAMQRNVTGSVRTRVGSTGSTACGG